MIDRGKAEHEDGGGTAEGGNMTAEERLIENGYEDVVIFKDYGYDDALIGVTEDNRAVYDFGRMVAWLVLTEGFEPAEAIEWIEYNTIRALPYAGEDAPIIMHALGDVEEIEWLAK